MRTLFNCDVILASVIAWLLASAAYGQHCDDPDTLRYAVLAVENRLTEISRPGMVMRSRLQEITAKKIVIIQPKSAHELTRLLINEEVDVALTPMKSYLYSNRNNPNINAFAVMPIMGQHSGIDAYRSVLISHIDSGIDSIAALKGRSLALVSTGSTSGYLAPHKLFTEVIQSPLADYFSSIVMSGQHDRSIFSLKDRRVDAAFVASTALSVLSDRGYIDSDNYRELWSSPGIPYPPFVYRASLCQALRDKISLAVLSMHEDRESLEWLNSINSPGPVSVIDTDYNVLRLLFDITPIKAP